MTLTIIFGNELSLEDVKDLDINYDIRDQIEYIVVTEPKNGFEDIENWFNDNKLWPFLKTLQPYIMLYSADVKFTKFRSQDKFIIIVWYQ